MGGDDSAEGPISPRMMAGKLSLDDIPRLGERTIALRFVPGDPLIKMDLPTDVPLLLLARVLLDGATKILMAISKAGG